MVWFIVRKVGTNSGFPLLPPYDYKLPSLKISEYKILTGKLEPNWASHVAI